MKTIVCIFIFLLGLAQLSASEINNRSHKNQKSKDKNKEENVIELIQEMLKDTVFVFNATDMMVRGGGNVTLGYDCDVQVKKEIVTSYLPFIGKAYNVSPDIKNSGLDFTLPMEDYYFQKKRNGFKAGFQVKNGFDHMNFTFYISKTGYTTLTVGSTRRQSISFYGTFNARK